MLAFSCVHCGQRMKITEDQEPKRASCPGCGAEVIIPDKASSGVRTLRKSRPKTEAATPPPERPLTPPGPVVRKPINDAPTRVEPTDVTPAALTAFLAPP